MAGADILWIAPEGYKRPDEIFKPRADHLRKIGYNPSIIPEWTSNTLGFWG